MSRFSVALCLFVLTGSAFTLLEGGEIVLFVIQRPLCKGSTVKSRRSPAAVTGDESREYTTVHTGREGAVSRVIREPEDLPVGARSCGNFVERVAAGDMASAPILPTFPREQHL